MTIPGGPTRPDDDFEAQIRLALGEHAGAAPHVDLAEGALVKARSIRRRRVALSTGAALVALAVAVPVGARLVDPGRHEQTATQRPTDLGVGPEHTPVTIAVPDLSTGAAPNTPYIAGDRLIEPDGNTQPATAAAGALVVDGVSLIDGALLWQQAEDDASKTTMTVAGGWRSNVPSAKSVTRPAIDSYTKAAVFALHNTDSAGRPAKTDTIVYADAVDGGAGSVDTVDTEMSVRQVMAAHNGQIVFNGRQQGTGDVVGVVDIRGDQGVSTPWENLKTVTSVSPDESLLAALPARGTADPGERRCSLLVQADSGQTLWKNCDWNPVEFSPDSGLVLAIPAYSDGFGPTSLAVLDTQTGSVVQEYRTRNGGTFGRATFDGASDAIVAVVVDRTQSAIVRCTVDLPECALATHPEDVKPYEPDSLVQPYQLTAN